jgi:hypothetical protein
MKVREIPPDQYFPFVPVWCLRSSFEKSTRWQQLKSNSNPPLCPLFQRGYFIRVILTPLWKRGEGEIFGRNDAAFMWRTFEVRTPVQV